MPIADTLPEPPARGANAQRVRTSTSNSTAPSSRQCVRARAATCCAQPDRNRPGAAVGVLPAARGSRSRLQGSQRRSRHPPDLPSRRTTHRSTHLRRFPRLLPARHVQVSAQAMCTWAHRAPSARQARRDPNARCAFPDHRRARTRSSPATPPPNRPVAAARATRLEPARAGRAAHQRKKHRVKCSADLFAPDFEITRISLAQLPQ